MLISFKMQDRKRKKEDPFNGQEIELARVPCIGEFISFSKDMPFIVVAIETNVVAWKEHFKVFLDTV